MQTCEVLTLSGLPIDPDSERYHTLYARLFCALVVKKITWKTSDSRTSTPSKTGIDDYLLLGETLMPRPTRVTMVVPVKEEATVPPTPIHQANITFADPVVDDAVAHIHAPKHEDKLNEAFEKHHNAAH